jgi:hypothetical protein
VDWVDLQQMGLLLQGCGLEGTITGTGVFGLGSSAHERGTALCAKFWVRGGFAAAAYVCSLVFALID